MRTEISIYDFDEVLGDVVLMRGLEYYENGHIISFDVFDDEVSAIVSGYDDYNVKMYIDDKGNILSHYCNCPYDMGEYCKHEVAVMYALREYFKTHTQKKVSKKELKDILKEQSVDVLAEILYDLACSDKKLRKRLCMRFKEKIDTSEKCISLARKYVDMYDKEDGINVDDTDELMEGIYIAIDKAEDLRENNTMEAVKAYIGIVDLLSSLEFYEDDYYDRYYYNYEECNMPEAVMSATDDLCDRIELFIGSKYSDDIFKIVYNKTEGDVYSIYYNLCVKFCDSDEKRKLIEKLITDLADEESRTYFEFELLEKIDNNNVNNFINKHLDNDYFRNVAIRNAFKEGDFERVINLENTAPKKDIYSYDRLQWKRLALESYEKLSKNDKAKEYIMFFINIGNDEYVEKYKKLCTYDEWTEARKTILVNYLGRYKDKYVKLLISENMIDELFNYCRTNKNTIFKLYGNFKEKYNDEAKSLFYSEIMEEADRICDRTSYRCLCSIIRKYGDKFDKEGMLRIINELRITQKRRPAFIDELNKIS